MRKTILAITASFLILSSSCEWLENNSSSGLSNSEIAEGLKTALEVGTDSSVFKTSAVDGFYKNAAIKILLPDEAQVIVNNINSVPGGPDLLEAVLLRINRSAEDAAKSATPILKDAVRGLTINEALTILNGQNPASSKKSASSFDSTAATGYLKSKTYVDLTTAFSTPINASLDKKLVGNISTNEAWKNLTSAYNLYASFPLVNKPTVNTNLGEHVTQKALNGLFYQVGNEEIKIRRDPWKWVTTTVGNILTKVFGS
jgi:hypothetical protein